MGFVETRRLAVQHLKQACPKLGPVVEAVGPCRLRLRRDRFTMLTRSILYQQISGHAAKAIHDRLVAQMPNGKFTAVALAGLSDEAYRAAGVSKQKVGYLRSLAGLTISGDLRLRGLDKRSDEEIIEHLVQIKGVGVWTSHMFLMFSMGRPDVLPWGDLGVRQAIRKLHGLDALPTRAECEEVARPWTPYRTFASWYCWRSLELETGGEYIL